MQSALLTFVLLSLPAFAQEAELPGIEETKAPPSWPSALDAQLPQTAAQRAHEALKSHAFRKAAEAQRAAVRSEDLSLRTSAKAAASVTAREATSAAARKAAEHSSGRGGQRSRSPLHAGGP